MPSELTESLTVRQSRYVALGLPIFVLATLLTGCIHENKYRAELASPSNNEKTSVVIISTGSPEPCGFFGTSTRLNIFPQDESFFPSRTVATLDVDSRYVETEFPEHHGGLYVFQLQSGKYALVPYLMNPYVNYFKAPKADFEVGSNEIVYLGEFFMPECEGSRGMEFRDQEARDLALLIKKNPAFAKVLVKKRLLMFTGRQPFWRF